MERLDFYRQLAALATGLTEDHAETDADGLEIFRTRIMSRPDDLRRRVLGENLLRKKALGAGQRRMLRNLDVVPDLLTPLGLLRSEVAHCKFLEHQLSDAEHPEIAAGTMRRLLELALDTVPWSDADLASATVRAEVGVGLAGRVDLGIDIADKLLVFVEAKVDATEGEEQLARYRKALDQRLAGRTGCLVFLTLPDTPTPAYDFDFKHITFRDLLLAWLPFTLVDPNRYLASYLKSVAVLLEVAGRGEFDNWSFATQRAALELVTRSETGVS